MRRGGLSALAIVSLLGPASARVQAQTFDVRQVAVEKGALEYAPETMFARGVPHALGADVNRHANEQTLHYGLTDWWRISGALKLEKPEQDDFRLAGAAVASLEGDR